VISSEGSTIRSQSFAVQAVQEDGHIRVSVTGDLDITTVDAFEHAIDRAVRHHCDLIVDFTDTTFMGACVLGALADARTRLCPEAKMTVWPGRQVHRQLLGMFGLDAVVSLVEGEGRP
jgi:anti-anti-sigma factor